jgi:hypothetical protein
MYNDHGHGVYLIRQLMGMCNSNVAAGKSACGSTDPQQFRGVSAEVHELRVRIAAWPTAPPELVVYCGLVSGSRR